MASGNHALPIKTVRPESDETERSRFLAIYDAHAESVYRYLLSRLRNTAEAQDLTSQTVLTAWEHFPRYRENGRAGAWLMSIARSKLVDFLRRENRQPEELFFPEPGGSAAIEESERRTRLQELIRRLPDSERELLRLRYTAGMQIAEIAGIVGRSEEAVKKSFQRLVGRLKSRMEVGNE
jgi:RNA polymerase sigma-70 factor (ECF subfamily)